MNKPRSHTAFPTLAESVADWIGEEILRGHWVPGRRITEAEVADHLGVSRQPVREALRTLGEQGLVRLIPRIGAVVRELDSDTIAELYELRALVESWLAVRAAKRISEEGIAKLEAEVDEWIERSQSDNLDVIAHYKRAWLIRREFLTAAGNMVAVDFAEDYRSRVRGFPNVIRRDPAHLKVMAKLLRDLVSCAKERRGSDAGAAVSNYLLANGAIVRAVFDRHALEE
jgi:DNA-binding GntR family transcriptional regulator